MTSFSQPIEMRMNELVSGVRSDFAVKVYGDDFATPGRLGARIGRTLQRVPGATDLKVDRVEGLPVFRAVVDRDAIARRGIDARGVLDAVAVIGGRPVGTVLEGRRRFQLRVRLPTELQNDLDAVRRLPVRLAPGGYAAVTSTCRRRCRTCCARSGMSNASPGEIWSSLKGIFSIAYAHHFGRG